MENEDIQNVLKEFVGMTTTQISAILEKRIKDAEEAEIARRSMIEADVEQSVLSAWEESGKPQTFTIEWNGDTPRVIEAPNLPTVEAIILQFHKENGPIERSKLPAFRLQSGEWVRTR